MHDVINFNGGICLNAIDRVEVSHLDFADNTLFLL